jgi:hypothetical protein
MLMMKLFKEKQGNDRIKRIYIGIRQDSDGIKNMQPIPRVYYTISEQDKRSSNQEPQYSKRLEGDSHSPQYK